jgi:serine/threonine protein kinase
MMSKNRSSGCLSRETINAVHAHDLPEAELAYAEEHLRRCKTCAAKADELRKGCEEMLDRLKGLRSFDLLLAHDPIIDQLATATHDDDASRFANRKGMPDIPGYEIRRIIGRGGMGIVYEAVQEKLGRRVALKLLPSVVGSANRNLVQRFRKEATAASKLHHSSIVPIYDFGEARDGYFYAMELLDGEPLSVIIKRAANLETRLISPTDIAALVGVGDADQSHADPGFVAALDPNQNKHAGLDVPSANVVHSSHSRSSSGRSRLYYSQVAKWIADVGDALHYAHLKQLIHRDVKPSNIMICRDGRVVLVDFGLVKETGDESVTKTGSLLGTYRYMSPEQVGAKRIKVDARTDVYSLGATLYELLALQPVFGASEQSELLGQILWREPAAPKKLVPSVPVDLQTICLKALQKSPHERYPTAGDMADDLRQFVNDLPIRARPIGWPRRTSKFLRRHPLASGLSSLILILVAVLSIVGMSYSREREQKLIGSLREANTLWDNGELEKASEIYEEFLSENPTHTSAWATLVNYAYVKKDQFYNTHDTILLEESLALANRAIEIDPSKSGGWNAKMIALRGLGRYEESLKACEKAPESGRNAYAIAVNKGASLAALGQHELAIGAFQEGIDSMVSKEGNPGSLPYRNQSAILLAKSNPEAWSRLDLALAARNGESNASIEGQRAMLRLSLKGHIDPKIALEDAIAADRMCNRPTAGNRRVLALARYKNNEFTAASEAAKSAIDLGFESDPLSWLIVAASQAQLGNTEDTQKALGKAMEFGQESNNDGVCTLDNKWVWCYPQSVTIELKSEVEGLLAAESN